jgi:hypothetical protein
MPFSICTHPHPPVPPASHNHNDLISIVVKDSQANDFIGTMPIKIARHLLTWYSSKLATGLADTNQTILIVQGSEDVWEAITNWLQHGTFGASPADNTFLSPSEYIDIYITADHYGMRAIKNAIIDTLFQCLHEEWDEHHQELAGCINKIYTHTSLGARIRSFCLYYFSSALSRDGFRNLATEGWHRDFLKTFVVLVWQKQPDSAPVDRVSWEGMNRCEWHEHGEPVERRA